MSTTEPTDGLGELTGAVVALRDAVNLERQARAENTRAIQVQIAAETQSRRRSNRRLLGIIAAIAIMVSFFIVQNNNRIADVEGARQQSRVNTCLADNEGAHKINAGNEAKAAILAADTEIQIELNALLEPIENQPLPVDPVRAQAQREFVATFTASKAKVEAAQATAGEKIAAAHVADRDCSPEAVNAFYTSKQN